MADQTITVEGLVLYDNWPGVPVPPPMPVGDITSSAVGINLVRPMWPVGTKWELYCYGDQVSVGVSYLQGYSTVIYLRGSADAGTAVATDLTVGVVPDDTIIAGGDSDSLHTVYGDTEETTHENSGLVAYALFDCTADYYGWYWCGGVFPVEYVIGATVASTLATDASVATGNEVSTVISEATGIAIRSNPTASQAPGVGISLMNDTTS